MEFLTGAPLRKALGGIIYNAKGVLLLMSPYIKLNDIIRKLIKKHEHNPLLHIIVIFGKNETDLAKSLPKVDFDFFKEFPFVSIIYAENLHAKYYANENEGLMTSLNLYRYSIENNIEFGYYSKKKTLEKILPIGPSVDDDAFDYARKITDYKDNSIVFIKRPVFDRKNTYKGSRVLIDNGYNGNYTCKKLSDFPEELEFQTGYCIRTGKPIPFDIKHPYSYEVYKEWSKYKNENYPEKYCHFSGEKSNGETSMKHPILQKNYQKAKKEYCL